MRPSQDGAVSTGHDADAFPPALGETGRHRTENLLLTEQPWAHGALQSNESIFRLLVDAVCDYGIFMLDPQGRITSWNSGAERIKGYTAAEILGRHFSTFYSEEDRARGHPEDELRIAREQGRYEEEAWLVRKDGSRFWANVVISAVYDDAGELYGFAKVTRDLTERKRAEQELLLAKNRAEEANHAKSNFLATISHELRTPLNAISGYVQLLDLGIHGVVNEWQHEALARIGTNQDHLLRLIDDLLAFAKLEAGILQFDLRRIPVCELMASVEALLAPLAQAKGITLETEPCDPSLDLLVDQERMRQILFNLIGNALKFTPPRGWVVLACDGDASGVSIHVRDSGPGIPLEKQQAIFDAFVQVDRRLNSPKEGVGLGLAISRELARAMGGDLSVASVPNQGSTFTLRFSRQETPEKVLSNLA